MSTLLCSQNYDWYCRQLPNSSAYPTLTSQCYKIIFFKNRDFSSNHFTSCPHLKVFVITQTVFNDFRSGKILRWTDGSESVNTNYPNENVNSKKQYRYRHSR